MRAFRFALLAAGLAFLCGEASGAGALYRQYRARRTFVADKGVHNPFGRPDVLAADFLTTEFAAADGSDIKVFAGDTGRPADFKVMMMGPGDRARIAIRMVPGVAEYHVCYGGPKDAARRKWEPEVGLILETRKFNAGDVGNREQMRKLVEASGPSYGTWFVPNVFQAANLFGPMDNYVSIYRGWLQVPKEGEYTFATTSDDASYFLLDGKVVAHKGTWGGGPANARLAGAPVTLKVGAYPIEYEHVEGRDWQFAVAAWKPPGSNFEVIPPSAFPGVFAAKQTDLEVTGSRVPIDLRYDAAGEVDYEGRRLYKVKFYDATPGGLGKPYAPQWFFGDGTSSDERDPEHVYFLPGEYSVTFALVRGEAAVRIRQKIVVGLEWEQRGQRGDDTAAHYHELTKDYDFKAMRTADADAALEFFTALGKDTEIMKVAAALVGRDDELARKNLFRYAVLLGERLRDLKGLPEEALVVFRAALKREPDEAKQANLTRCIGDTLLYALHKPDEAIAEYRKILDRHGKLEDNVVRLARIRVGDAWKAKGDGEKAKEAFAKAEEMLPYERSHAVNSVRRGSFAQSIEGYLAAKQFAEAQSQLDVWGWEHPTDRILGGWSLVAAKVALAKGDKDSAIREAVECANANKTGPYADELLAFAGRVLIEAGRGVEAVELARRIQKEFPESAWQEQAALVECQGLHLAKRYEEAARRATESYAKYAGGEGAAKFLLVAANAALALSDKAAAVRALQLILKDHARSDSAEEAKSKLKALGGN